MTWAKIDDKLHSDTKARKAGMPAMGLWVMCLSHCASHLTDGFVDDTDVEMIGGPGALDLAARLVKVGLWTRDSEREGYVFHNYLKYNPSAEDVLSAREQAKARRSRKKSLAVDEPASSERNANVERTDGDRIANVMRTSPDARDTISLRSHDDLLPRPDPTRPDQIPPTPQPKTEPLSRAEAPTVGGDVGSHEPSRPLPSSSQASRDRGSGTLLQSKLAKAYAEGIQQAAPGVPYPVPRDPADLLALEDTAAANFRGNAGVFEAPAWVTASAKAYRLACADRAQYESGFSPRKWAAWVRSGEQARVPDTRRGQGATIPTADDPPPALRPERRPVPESYTKLVETGDTSGLPKIPPRPPVRLRRSFGTVDMDVDMPPTPTTPPAREPVES